MSLVGAMRVAKTEQEKKESSKAVNTESSKALDAVENEAAEDEKKNIEFAALTVRVPKEHRIHWLVSAKKQRTTLTAAITEALNARFGEPTEED